MKKIILFFILLWAVNCKAQGIWSSLDEGIDCRICQQGGTWRYVNAICPDSVNNILFVGGHFDSVNNIYALGLAKWDGSKWDSIPKARFANVKALLMHNGNLYVGDFDSYNVWIYNGDSLSPMPAFKDGGVTALCIYKDTLYAAGSFTRFGNTTLNHIAKWDGTQWQPLKTGFTSNFLKINAMTVYHDTLFVGGYFTMADTVPAYSIAKWDGTNWSAVGDNGVTFWSGNLSRSPAYVFALGSFQGNLYVGGCYDSVGGKPAGTTVGIWNGSNWDTMPHPSFEEYDECDGLGALKAFDGYLFLYGSNEYISKWDGNTVTNVDSGTNDQISSLAVWNGSLYVGGIFDTAGKTVVAHSIARWTPDTTTSAKNIISNISHLSSTPNPFSQNTTVKLQTQNQQPWQFVLQDLVGRTVTAFEGVQSSLTITRNNLPAGLYIGTAKDEQGNLLGRIKLVVQ